MRKCLVTGATGLIGQATIKLLKNDWEIYTLGLNNHFQNIFYINCDLSLPILWNDFPEKVDAVIHLAQSKHFREFPEQANDIFQVNIASTVKLLEYARKVGANTFILASSGGIYGNGDEGFTEDKPIVVNSDLGFYLNTKLCSELLAENYTPYMNLVMLRFFFVYGPGQRPDMLIPRLIKSVNEGRPIVLDGQDGIRINPTFVSDAASAVYNALDLEGTHKINIGGPEILSLREIGEKIGKVIGKKPVFEIHKNQPRNLVGDIKKMSNFLWKPQINFENGIKKYLENQE